ncbi:MAG TPA: hypothetical protein VG478_02415 [Acidimicrobiales bacterium]|nr:hypothetical protein [Acidimicrobiales bacterium]
MGAGAAVVDARAPEWVLVGADAGVGNGSVGLAELAGRDNSQPRPELDGGIEIQSLMQVETETQSSLVHVEESAEPRDEEQDHAWIAVGECDRAIGLRTFAGVERDAGDEEVTLGEPADAGNPFGSEVVDLGLLAECQLGGSVVPTGMLAWLRHEVDVPHPERDGASRRSELASDLLECPRLRP